MKKISFEELEQAGIKAAEAARESARKAGTFFSYSVDGKVIREYPDGRRTEVIYDGNGNHKEIEYTG